MTNSVLVCFANPEGTSRLRLDQEHKMLDLLIDAGKVPKNQLERLHATEFSDITRVINSSNLKILQFSGHGSAEGFFIESKNDPNGRMMTPTELKEAITLLTPNLEALILMSCYSANTISELQDTARYVITVEGPASDNVAIEFSKHFYTAYFRTHDVGSSLKMAKLHTGYHYNFSDLQVVAARRVETSAGVSSAYQFSVSNFNDPVYINIDQAIGDIERLDISLDGFLRLLSRKIKIHAWIFERPRENAVIQIGQYFGTFSWRSVDDMVFCHKIQKLSSDASGEVTEIWASILLSHNDGHVAPYRVIEAPSSTENSNYLTDAIYFYTKTVATLDRAVLLADVIADQYKASSATMKANLNSAKDKYKINDYSGVIVCLETCLSALHDVVNALTAKITD